MNTIQKYEKYFYIILAIGIVIYFPIFFNSFVWDDIVFIIYNPQVHQLNLPVLFGNNIFNSDMFYRPIPAVYYAIVYTLSGQNAFWYHLFQLILHLTDTSLLFLFFCLFFSDGIAFFLALLFLVHPINVESVAYIGATQSELYFLPGLIALLLSQQKSPSKVRFFWIIGLLLLAALAKETGFLFLLLAIASRYLFNLNKLKEFLFSGAFIIGIYALLRFSLGGATSSAASYTVPIATLSFSQRLINIPAIFSYYLKTFLLPIQLTIFQTWIVTNISLQGFILPLLICILFFVGVILLYYFLVNQSKKQPPLPQKHQKQNTFLDDKVVGIKHFLFFTLWFLMGIALVSQIIPLEMTVADRWFYFPIVGLLGLIGIVIQVFLPAIKKYYTIYLYAAIALVCLLSLRTLVRTLDWKDNLTIHADAQHASNDNYMLDYSYAYYLFNTGKPNEDIVNKAIAYDKESINVFPTLTNISFLGDMYRGLNQCDKAIDPYNQALSFYKGSPSSRKVNGFVSTNEQELYDVYNDLAYCYNSENQPQHAIDLITNRALPKFPDDPDLKVAKADLYVGLAVAYTNLSDHEQAVNAITKAYSLRPDPYTTTLYNKIKDNIPLN